MSKMDAISVRLRKRDALANAVMNSHCERCDIAVILPGTVVAVALEAVLFLTRLQYVWEHAAQNAPMAQIYIAALLAAGFLIWLVGNVAFDAFDLFGLLVVICMALWGIGKYSVLYAALFLLVILWRKILIIDLTYLYRCFIIFGLLFCLVFSAGSNRWIGFSSSPTMFSLVLSLAVTYLLFSDNPSHSKRVDYCFTVIALFLIWKSETRLFMGYSALIVAYFFSSASIERIARGLSAWNRRIILAVIGLCAFAFIALNLDFVMEIFSRDNGEASTNTRFSLYAAVYNNFISSPKTFLIGSGGGTAMEAVRILLARSTPFPVHQDFLVLLCDYGLCGATVVLFAVFGRFKWRWYMWLFLFLCTFHNVMTSGVSLLFIVVTFQSLLGESAFDIRVGSRMANGDRWRTHGEIRPRRKIVGGISA